MYLPTFLTIFTKFHLQENLELCSPLFQHRYLLHCTAYSLLMSVCLNKVNSGRPLRLTLLVLLFCTNITFSLAVIFCVGAAGLSFLQFCNLNSFRTKFILGFSVFMGFSVPQYFNEYTAIKGFGPVHTSARWVGPSLL